MRGHGDVWLRAKERFLRGFMTLRRGIQCAWLQARHDWPGLAAIGKVAATREIRGGRTEEPYLWDATGTAPPSKTSHYCGLTCPTKPGQWHRSPTGIGYANGHQYHPERQMYPIICVCCVCAERADGTSDIGNLGRAVSSETKESKAASRSSADADTARRTVVAARIVVNLRITFLPE